VGAQVGLAPKAECFILYIIYVCLFALMGSGFGLFIGATVLDIQKAITLSIIVVLSSVMLGGFFIRQSNLRPWVRWARWISFMKYSFELLLLNEFDVGDQTFTPSARSAFTTNPITGDDVLNNLGVETNIWGDVRRHTLSLEI
jgi:ABC-type multidrug transport system permease subunit